MRAPPRRAARGAGAHVLVDATYWKGRNLIHFAASKKHLGLYPGGEATAVFAEELRDFDVSKGTIRIPWNRELPAALIQKIAGWCYEEYGK